MALPVEQHQRLMFSEAERLRTYGSWPIRDVMSPEELASAGFYYTGVHDRVQCAFCRGILRNWEHGDNAMNEHRIHFSSCLYARGMDCGNVALQSTPSSGAALASLAIATGSELVNQIDGCVSLPGVSTSKPKHPQHAAEVHRLQTFRTWPTWTLQSPDRLAKAGFFYVGSSDNVRCFFCDGGLRNWDASSDPWEEHARCFPNCEYVARLKGTAFVNSVQRKQEMPSSDGMHREGASYVNRSTVSKAEERKETVGRLEHCSVQLLLRLGYAMTLIQSVLDTHFPQYTSGIYPSSAQLLKAALTTTAGNENPADACSDALARRGESSAAIAASARVEPDAIGSEATDSGRHSIEFSNSAARSSTATAYISHDQPPKDTVGITGNGDADEIVQLRKYVECKICSRQRAEFLLLPCGHLGLCSDCVSSVRTCPACNTVVRGSLRVFLC